VLRKLRDSKGAVYTDALAHAIHRLEGSAKGQARDALTDRLTRMSARTLTDKLQDDDLEVRRAAALACAMKDERAHVPRLIEMLQDEAPVAPAAHAALKSLTGQDFGPAPEARQADVARAVAAWKDWWAKNS
jgi:HEAT repeat protein